MALFKAMRGDSARIDFSKTPFHDGYAYLTTDDGGLYFDAMVRNQPTRIRVDIDFDNKIPTITETTTLDNIANGETVSVMLGKIKKAIGALKTHLSGTVTNVQYNSASQILYKTIDGEAFPVLAISDVVVDGGTF